MCSRHRNCVFIAFTILIVKLSKQLCTQTSLKGNQDPKILSAIRAISLGAILFACLLRAIIDAEEKKETLFAITHFPPEDQTLEEVLWASFTTDVCIRLLVLKLKALVALQTQLIVALNCFLFLDIRLKIEDFKRIFAD